MKYAKIAFFLAVTLHLGLFADKVRAAFDVGSGQTKITIAQVNDKTGRPKKVLFTEETPLLLGHDFKKNKGQLSDQILNELEKLLTHYRDLALNYGAVEMAGVATAVFRESKNGPDFIKKARDALGIDLKLISQAEEGKLGFLTAVGASGKNAKDLVAWDSGGGSFQISTEIANEMSVFEGPWGASKVLAAMVEIQGQDFTKIQTANPATFDQIGALQEVIKKALKPVKPELSLKLIHPTTSVVAIGGPFSPFKMAALALGQTTFTKEDIWSAILHCSGRSDSELAKYFPEPEMVIPRLTLIYTVMNYFGMEVFQYCETCGSTLGILMSPQFWTAKPAILTH